VGGGPEQYPGGGGAAGCQSGIRQSGQGTVLTEAPTVGVHRHCPMYEIRRCDETRSDWLEWLPAYPQLIGTLATVPALARIIRSGHTDSAGLPMPGRVYVWSLVPGCVGDPPGVLDAPPKHQVGGNPAGRIWRGMLATQPLWLHRPYRPNWLFRLVPGIMG
jgi:hypothetical protein